ncbi:hypothetical protein MHYP_G00062540 [Metynnis hypsauchen]
MLRLYYMRSQGLCVVAELLSLSIVGLGRDALRRFLTRCLSPSAVRPDPLIVKGISHKVSRFSCGARLHCLIREPGWHSEDVIRECVF